MYCHCKIHLYVTGSISDEGSSKCIFILGICENINGYKLFFSYGRQHEQLIYKIKCETKVEIFKMFCSTAKESFQCI